MRFALALIMAVASIGAASAQSETAPRIGPTGRSA